MTETTSLKSDILQTFDDIITGSVKRFTHALTYQGRDWTAEFVERLEFHQFRDLPVSDVPIEAGERIVGFYLVDAHAIFGWVRWEKFQEGVQRKFWGSVEPNKKGDWKYQVPAGSKRTVWCNLREKRTMDIHLPQGLV